MSDSKRPLLKGPPCPPRSNPSALSYTEPPRCRNEVIRTKGDSVRVVEFNGSATPQPFLDPSIMQERARLERRQFERNQPEGSSTS